MAARVFASGMAAINAIATHAEVRRSRRLRQRSLWRNAAAFQSGVGGLWPGILPTSTPPMPTTLSAPSARTRAWFTWKRPTNPLMRLSDIAPSAQICRRKKARPGGRQHVHVALFSAAARAGRRHGGALDHQVPEWPQRRAGRSGGLQPPEQAEKLAFLQKAAGAILSPFECWLVLRGVKTLAARMEIHDRSGRVVADFLASTRKCRKFSIPAWRDHPQHELAQAADERLWFDDHI